MKIYVTGGPLGADELAAYEELAREKYGDNVVALDINIENEEEVTLTYTVKDTVPFERIRRITGYLVGTLDRWNSAKRAEEHDRVKHSVNSTVGD